MWDDIRALLASLVIPIVIMIGVPAGVVGGLLFLGRLMGLL